MDRRSFLKVVAAGSVTAAFAGNLPDVNIEPESPIWTPCTRKEFIEGTQVYVTSAFWNDSKDAAKAYRKRYDAVCIPGISIREDGKLEMGSMIEDAKVEGKPQLYIIQNHPEGDTWRAERASAFMGLDDIQLRDELAQFKHGIVLDLESMTEEMNSSYHIFVERVRNAYDGPLIVSLHAKRRYGNQVYGLGVGMDYKAICDIADAVNYMTLDAWPDNPEVPIADLNCFKETLDTLFEDEGINSSKLIASIATYIKVSYLKEDGSFDKEIKPEQGPATEMLRKLENITIEDAEEGQFVALYNGRRVLGWMMTEDAFRARVVLLREMGREMGIEGIDKVALWYGGKFLEDTPNLLEIVRGEE